MLQTFQDQQEWITKTTAVIQSLISNSSSSTIALSGGSTPTPVYTAMKDIPSVDSIHFYQVDERYVPANHAKSNYKLIQETLAPRHFHHFDTSLPIDEALQQYQTELPEKLNLCILGLGTDGHTASLFPHAPALNSTNAVAKTNMPGVPTSEAWSHRLTLTFPTIMASDQLLLLVKGQNKQSILDELLHSDQSIPDLPAKKLLEHPNLTIHYLNS